MEKRRKPEGAEPSGFQMGLGVRHALFPGGWTLGARILRSGSQLPDAVLHGKRSSFRSRSRTGRLVSQTDNIE
jgi:hypothetical protein